MEQIVLLLNPCFPLVSLSGFPPPFHLPAVLVKPGPQRHLLSVMGSWAGPGSPPHLPCFAMGGRVMFWLLSGEFVLKLTYQVTRELLPWLLGDLSSGTARTGGKASHVAAPPKPGLHSLHTSRAGFDQPSPTDQPQFLQHPAAAPFPGGTEAVGTSWPTAYLGPGAGVRKWPVPESESSACEDRTHPWPRASAVSPLTGGETLWGWRLPLSLRGLPRMQGQE